MAERNLTVEELKAEIEITERDLAQLRTQLRVLEGSQGILTRVDAGVFQRAM